MSDYTEFSSTCSIDGGVRRAVSRLRAILYWPATHPAQGDVLKAVALGAKGVGIGRPFLYAYSACEYLTS